MRNRDQQRPARTAGEKFSFRVAPKKENKSTGKKGKGHIDCTHGCAGRGHHDVRPVNCPGLPKKRTLRGAKKGWWPGP